VAVRAHVYIVDDDEAVRDSLAVLLAAQPYAVSSFASAEEFLAAATSLAIGCLIVDMRMPGMSGLDLQRRLNEQALYFPTIVLAGHGDVPLAVCAMKGGAVDFIEKPYAIEAILGAIEVGLARLAGSEPGDPAATEAAARLALLTPREREVLEGLFSGLPNKSIAYELAISPRTVEVHRARLMQKLQARSLSEVVRLALAAACRRTRDKSALPRVRGSNSPPSSTLGFSRKHLLEPEADVFGQAIEFDDGGQRAEYGKAGKAHSHPADGAARGRQKSRPTRHGSFHGLGRGVTATPASMRS
jgi:two-component system, LuxR family, response regulator FixJ